MNISELNTPALSIEGIEQFEQLITGVQAAAFLVASSKDECYRSTLSAPVL